MTVEIEYIIYFCFRFFALSVVAALCGADPQYEYQQFTAYPYPEVVHNLHNCKFLQYIYHVNVRHIKH